MPNDGQGGTVPGDLAHMGTAPTGMEGSDGSGDAGGEPFTDRPERLGGSATADKADPAGVTMRDGKGEPERERAPLGKDELPMRSGPDCSNPSHDNVKPGGIMEPRREPRSGDCNC